MPDRTNLIYSYDGTFDGLLCCVFESYTCRERPLDIRRFDAEEVTLYPVKEIVSSRENAERVYASIQKKIGASGGELISRAFLSGNREKEMVIYRFIRFGYRYGPASVNMLGEEIVSELHHTVRAVNNETHLLLGFTRFSEYNGGLAAVIEPKHFVLPLMAGHFKSRYSEEHFMIYDKTHGMALVYQPYECRIISVEDIQFPEEGEQELQYRRLWKGYYDAIAIRERENPRCRMGHMPKRFWSHLTEMQETVPRLAAAQTKLLEEKGRMQDENGIGTGKTDSGRNG